MEIDQASRLLPYLVTKQQQPEVPRQPEVERGTMDDVLGAQPLRRENADLRRCVGSSVATRSERIARKIMLL